MCLYAVIARIVDCAVTSREKEREREREGERELERKEERIQQTRERALCTAEAMKRLSFRVFVLVAILLLVPAAAAAATPQHAIACCGVRGEGVRGGAWCYNLPTTTKLQLGVGGGGGEWSLDRPSRYRNSSQDMLLRLNRQIACICSYTASHICGTQQ